MGEKKSRRKKSKFLKIVVTGRFSDEDIHLITAMTMSKSVGDSTIFITDENNKPIFQYGSKVIAETSDRTLVSSVVSGVKDFSASPALPFEDQGDGKPAHV